MTLRATDALREERLKKLQQYEAARGTAYPIAVAYDMPLKELRERFEELRAGGSACALAGRVLSVRGQGGVIFFDIHDGTGKFQCIAKKGALPDGDFALLADTLDIGDIVSVQGALMVTARGEESIEVRQWRFAAKSLRPLPDKRHGLKDDDERSAAAIWRVSAMRRYASASSCAQKSFRAFVNFSLNGDLWSLRLPCSSALPAAPAQCLLRPITRP